MPNQTNPLRGLLYALLLTAIGAAFEYVVHWLVVPSLFCLLALYLLACRLVRWVMRHPAVHRLLAACVLLLCRPRPIDKKLYFFCFPNEKAHAQA